MRDGLFSLFFTSLSTGSRAAPRRPILLPIFASPKKKKKKPLCKPRGIVALFRLPHASLALLTAHIANLWAQFSVKAPWACSRADWVHVVLSR